jgi:glycosyltransferase involved in cell wall biosynthesis
LVILRRYLAFIKKIKELFQAMKIAINARLMKPVPDDGISRFTYEVVRRLVTGNSGHKYVLIFDTNPDGRLNFLSGQEIHVISPASRHPVLWYTWHEWQLPRILKRSEADIFFSPDGIISLRSSIPAIPVIHDINFYHRPKDVPLLTSLYYRYFFSRFAARARRIITVSDFCRDDISINLKIDREIIDVAHNGVSDYFVPSGPVETAAYRKSLTNGVPFFLFVGNFSPRKNIPGLIDSYNLFRSRSGLNHKLVLTGGRLYLNHETDRLIKSSPFRDDIILTGGLKHEDLALLYSSATALVFIPWFEGFGIPAVEAMRCGTPVILSNTTSLPEIGGNSAIFVNPGDPAEVSAAMLRITSDEKLRSSLSGSGLIQARKFTWDNTAASVLRSLESAALM